MIPTLRPPSPHRQPISRRRTPRRAAGQRLRATGVAHERMDSARELLLWLADIAGVVPQGRVVIGRVGSGR
ncbi:MAG: hypothetical protein HOY78_19440 [Saccharothrix sp.]|nr:hypothetical protein [Saccharothrix sp.]